MDKVTAMTLTLSQKERVQPSGTEGTDRAEIYCQSHICRMSMTDASRDNNVFAFVQIEET